MKSLLSIIFLSLFFSIPTRSSLKSICGEDDRIISNNFKVARIQRSNGVSGCTFTLIGRSCGVSVGHCENHFKEAHFNVPLSNNFGRIRRSIPEDIYSVTQGSIRLRNNGFGKKKFD